MQDLSSYKFKKGLYELLFAVGILLIIIGYFTFRIIDKGFIYFIFGLPLIIFMPILFKRLSISFKTIYVDKAFKDINPSLIYQPKEGLNKEFIYDCHVLRKEDKFTSEDYVSGSILEHQFISSDVHLQHLHSNGKSTYYVTVFKGRVYQIKMSKTLTSPVYIMPNLYNNLKIREGMEKIDLESIEFNQKFDVYAHEKFDAFYLITSKMIMRIMDFSSKAKRIMISYEEDRLTIALDTGIDYFDLKMFRPIDISYIQEIKDELNLIEEIIVQLSK